MSGEEEKIINLKQEKEKQLRIRGKYSDGHIYQEKFFQTSA